MGKAQAPANSQDLRTIPIAALVLDVDRSVRRRIKAPDTKAGKGNAGLLISATAGTGGPESAAAGAANAAAIRSGRKIFLIGNG